MNTTVVPPIGERIREERARLGVTVRGLARDIGVSASLISQIETGRSQPSVSTLYAIVTALGISIEDLFATGDAAPESVDAVPEASTSELARSTTVGMPTTEHASPQPTRTLGRDRRRLVGPSSTPTTARNSRWKAVSYGSSSARYPAFTSTSFSSPTSLLARRRRRRARRCDTQASSTPI